MHRAPPKGQEVVLKIRRRHRKDVVTELDSYDIAAIKKQAPETRSGADGVNSAGGVKRWIANERRNQLRFIRQF